MNVLKSLALYAAILLLASCGFHLRTYNFEAAVESFALASEPRIRVAQPLRQGLLQAGVQETDVASAALVVELLDQRLERRSASTAGQAGAAEYEMTHAVEYRILNGAGEELAPATWVQRDRIFRVDRDNIVGSSEEQALLEAEMTQDLVGQIIRAMDAVSRQLID
jgi:LPS-assembly lipoprotein